MQEYTVADVATHNTETSLWLVIEGKVYDVTKFQDDHPGGPYVLLETAGTDAGNAFDEVMHSEQAKTEMEPLQIGTVKGYVHVPEKKKEKKGHSLVIAGVAAVAVAGVGGSLYWLNKRKNHLESHMKIGQHLFPVVLRSTSKIHVDIATQLPVLIELGIKKTTSQRSSCKTVLHHVQQYLNGKAHSRLVNMWNRGKISIQYKSVLVGARRVNVIVFTMPRKYLPLPNIDVADDYFGNFIE